MKSKLDDTGGAKELAIHRLNIAKDDLKAAERNLAESDYRTANNRAYYAIYHAICACMALRFEAYKTHGQTIGAFHKGYIHKGLFPKEIGHRINKAQEIRHCSDYDDFYIVSRNETEEQVDTASQFIKMVEAFINQEIK